MTRYLIASLISLSVNLVQTQALAQNFISATLDANHQLAWVQIRINDVDLFIDGEGILIDHSVLASRPLLNFDYYDQFDAEEKRGKIKTIGRVNIDYYDRFDRIKSGKVSRINRVQLDYYDQFNPEFKGWLKAVNGELFTYYDRFSSPELRGKIKSIGAMKITYFDRFDGPYRSGRVKSVANARQSSIHLQLDERMDDRRTAY